jgi:hypothetical protein
VTTKLTHLVLRVLQGPQGDIYGGTKVDASAWGNQRLLESSGYIRRLTEDELLAVEQELLAIEQEAAAAERAAAVRAATEREAAQVARREAQEDAAQVAAGDATPAEPPAPAPAADSKPAKLPRRRV